MVGIPFLYPCRREGNRSTRIDVYISTDGIRQYDDDGIPFRTHLHVPEVHPETGTTLFEREDEGHMLKVHDCTFMHSHIMQLQYTLAISYMHVVFVHLSQSDLDWSSGSALVVPIKFLIVLSSNPRLNDHSIIHVATLGYTSLITHIITCDCVRENQVYGEEKFFLVSTGFHKYKAFYTFCSKYEVNSTFSR